MDGQSVYKYTVRTHSEENRGKSTPTIIIWTEG